LHTGSAGLEPNKAQACWAGLQPAPEKEKKGEEACWRKRKRIAGKEKEKKR
jgi:hypothetical protein